MLQAFEGSALLHGAVGQLQTGFERALARGLRGAARLDLLQAQQEYSEVVTRKASMSTNRMRSLQSTLTRIHGSRVGF